VEPILGAILGAILETILEAVFGHSLDVVHFSKNIFSKNSKNLNQFFEKFQKISKNLYFVIIFFGSKRPLLRYNMTIDYVSWGH
jgi:hypothetical protein